jgi:hypothetical protein
MKTLDEINELIEECVKRSDRIRKDHLMSNPDKKRAIKPIVMEFDFLKKLRNCLEFNPSEYILKAQKQAILKSIEAYDNEERYAAWHTWNKWELSPKKKYEKTFIKPLQDKLKTLNFILDDDN